ncbi:MAG: dienelactone hydrolase family protein [SAR202 cluster bacterium]|nr:dienelactone hydrolase family protein [SAR202 cluster bacterium]
MGSTWANIYVAGKNMPAYVSMPAGSGPYPAVVVIQHGPGVDGFVTGVCDRLAAEGYVAVAPSLYYRQASNPELEMPSPSDPNFRDRMFAKIGQLKDKGIVIDVNATTSYLESLPNVNRAAIGITGFCMGGRLTYLMAASNPIFKAAAPFYGGNIMGSWGGGPTPFELSKNIRCPILFFFGNDDQNPSPADRQKLDAELTALNKPHTFVAYDGAGHGFMAPGPNHREHAAKDAWPKLVEFFNQYLKGKVPARA